MHVLPKLNYDYAALEPYIDAKTMEIHYTKHHQAYLDKFNAALENYPDLAAKSAEELLSDLNALPAEIKTAVQNNGGGYVNHSLFWSIMAPGGGEMSEQLKTAVEESFGSLDKFKEEFAAAAVSRFGSGWAWLIVNPQGKLEITSTANQDTPLSAGQKPILCLDVWEHAYYLNYQNRRADYISAWWNVVDWSAVSKNFVS